MITQARLIELYHYDPKWGLFTRRSDGKVARSLNRLGFVTVYVDDILYTAHKLAWLYVHGEYTKKQLKHRDGDKTNNAIDNIVFAIGFEKATMNEDNIIEFPNKVLKYIRIGYKPCGNHLVKEGPDNTKSYILSYMKTL
jgi:hypothetical protein